MIILSLFSIGILMINKNKESSVNTHRRIKAKKMLEMGTLELAESDFNEFRAFLVDRFGLRERYCSH